MATLEERLAGYVATKLAAAGDVRVEGLTRIFGGASRETYRFVMLRWLPDLDLAAFAGAGAAGSSCAAIRRAA